MWPLTGPSALKPSLVGVGALTACAPPTSSVGGSRPHRSRHSLCSRRVSLDVSRLSLDGRRASLSAWPSPVAAATALASSPSATDLCLEEPFSLAWAFASLDTHPESRADGHETSGASTPRRSTSDSAPSPVPQQVTRHNFHLALPLVAEALQECTFFALDCEFTGLSPQAPHFSELYDDAADRYHRVLSSSQQFAVMQLGLSMYVRDEHSGAYTARTFNFSVFPKPSGPHDRRFLCQASSLEFLASQGFDFNRWIYDGIPYLQLAARDRHVADLAQAGVAAPAIPSPTSPQALGDFAATGGFSQVLELIRRCGKPVVVHNGLADLVYTLQQFACPLPDNWDEFKPLALSWFTGGVYDTRVLAGHMMAEAQLPGMFQDLSLSQVHAALAPGASVEATLRSCGASSSSGNAADGSSEQPQLPAVCHAPGYSLYPDGCPRVAASASSSSGAATPLAKLPQDPVHGVAAVEPACLMASLPASSSPVSSPSFAAAAASTSASTFHAAPTHEAGYDAYLTGAVFARLARAAQHLLPSASSSSTSTQADLTEADSDSETSTAGSEAAGPTTPCPGSPRTANDPAQDLASCASTSAAVTPTGPLSALHAWRGRLHSMRADVPFLNLHGADPLPNRPHVFYLSNLPLHTKVSTVAARFSDAGLGRVRVVMLGQPGEASMTGSSVTAGMPSSSSSASSASRASASASTAATSKSAFVQLLQPELADQVLPAVKAMGVPWKAMPYADYHASKLRLKQQQEQVQNNIVPATITVQAVPQHAHSNSNQQPKYKLVKVPEDEQLQQQGPGRVKVGSTGGKTLAVASQQSTRQRLTPTAAPAGESASGATPAAPKRYITVMRKVASSVLAPMQQAQGQGQSQAQDPVQVQAGAAPQPASSQCQADSGEVEGVAADAAAAAVPVTTAIAAAAVGMVPPPPPPPPRTPPRAQAAV